MYNYIITCLEGNGPSVSLVRNREWDKICKTMERG